MKRCPDCKEEKPDDAFYLASGQKGSKEYRKHLGAYCKPCWKLRNHAYNIRKAYGANREWYWKKVKEQDGLCAICHRPDPYRKLSIDHDHKSDQIRDLLCTHCNTALGSFGDSPELLREALKYLQKWSK